VFRNYTSATLLVASDCGRGVLKASWTRPSSFFKRSGPTKFPETSPLRLGQWTVCRRTCRFEEGLDQTKAQSVADVRADMVRNSNHWGKRNGAIMSRCLRGPRHLLFCCLSPIHSSGPIQRRVAQSGYGH